MQEKYVDRHVAPRKQMQLDPGTHAKAQKLSWALSYKTGKRVTMVAAIAVALDRELKELREVE